MAKAPEVGQSTVAAAQTPTASGRPLFRRGWRYWLWLIVGLVPLFAALPAQRHGVFVSSDAWDRAWPGVFAAFLAIGAALLGFDQLVQLVLRRRRAEVPAATGRLVSRAFLAALIALLPLWAWAMSDLVFKRLAHDAFNEGAAFIPATMISYNKAGKNGHYVIVESGEFGRIRLGAASLATNDVPAKGASVIIAGHHSWAGVSYDTLAMPE